MAGRKETRDPQKYIGDEPIADYIARMGEGTLKDPAVSNALGFQKAVGAKQGPSFIGKLWDRIKNTKPPEMPEVDWKKIKDFFTSQDLVNPIARDKKEGKY